MIAVRTAPLPKEPPLLPPDMPLSWHAYFAAAGDGNRVGRATELCLLYRMCREAGIPLAPIEVTERGKPDFRGGGYHFNFSGAAGLCAVALADAPVGVDVELYMDLPEERLGRFMRMLTDAERAHVAASQAPARTFIECWVRKEAAVKMTGEGMVALRRTTPRSLAYEARPAIGKDEYYLCAVLGEQSE